jgi:hypothetical protein
MMSDETEGARRMRWFGSARGNFAGHQWRVVAIEHEGENTPVPVRYHVFLQFAKNGDFGANDSVNFHSGTYRLVSGGFAISKLRRTLVGYAGEDPVILRAAAAISAFSRGVDAKAAVTGDRLEVTVGGYLLDCQRDGKYSDAPLRDRAGVRRPDAGTASE